MDSVKDLTKLGISYSSTRRYSGNLRPYDGLYGPWNSINEFVYTMNGDIINDSNVKNFIRDHIGVGLTIGIIEDGNVVEYWKIKEGGQFVKKKANDVVDTYSTAIILATSGNIGNIINVRENETVDGVEYEAGMYMVTGNGTLEKISFDKDTSKILDNIEEYSTDEELPKNQYISNIVKENGSIVPISKPLDTENILLKGNDSESLDEFLRVTGVNIGSIEDGDVIPNGMGLDELIKRILNKEIDVKIGNKPSVKLTGAPTVSVCEVGETLSGELGYVYTDGNFVGSENTYVTNQPAGCEIVENGVEYTPESNYNFFAVEGENAFSVKITYSQSTNTPVTNMGNESSVSIASGSCMDKKSVRGAYKFWYGHIDKEYLSELCGDEISQETIEHLKSLNWGWTNGGIESGVSLGDYENDENEMFFSVCPEGYKLYGEMLGLSVNPVINENIFDHTLGNGDIIRYSIYLWTASNVTYHNNSIIRI